ncbi:HdeD family acid-resistance protein [Halobacteriaceae archaeon GCM10025711]
MSTDVAGTDETIESMELVGSWRTMMGAGVLLALLGVLAIIFPFVTGISLSILLGALLVVGSILHFAHAFSAQGWKGFIWQVLLGVLYVFAGISLLANPVLGLATLTILLIAFFVVDGVVELVMGFQLRGQTGWGWMMASGVLSLLVAGLIWTGLPSSAAWAVGLLFGIGLLSSGVSMMVVARSSRKLADSTSPPAGETPSA